MLAPSGIERRAASDTGNTSRPPVAGPPSETRDRPFAGAPGLPRAPGAPTRQRRGPANIPRLGSSLLMHSGQERCRAQRAELRALLGLDRRVDHRGLWLELVARQGFAADLAVDVLGDLGVLL